MQSWQTVLYEMSSTALFIMVTGHKHTSCYSQWKLFRDVIWQRMQMPAILLPHSFALHTILTSLQNILYILVFEKTDCIQLAHTCGDSESRPFSFCSFIQPNVLFSHYTRTPQAKGNRKKTLTFNFKWISDPHYKGLYSCMDYTLLSFQ